MSGSVGDGEAPQAFAWTSARVQLARREADRYAAVRKLIELTVSSHSFVGIEELEEETGLPLPKIQGQLSGFSRRIKTLFGSSATWPFDSTKDVGGSDRKMYMMRPAVAEAWKQEE